MSWVGVPTRGEGGGEGERKGGKWESVTGERRITMQRETAKDRERGEGEGDRTDGYNH